MNIHEIEEQLTPEHENARRDRLRTIIKQGECPCCMKKCKSLLKHLVKSSDCVDGNDGVGRMVFEALKREARGVTYKTYNSSEKGKRRHLTYERTDRGVSRHKKHKTPSSSRKQPNPHPKAPSPKPQTVSKRRSLRLKKPQTVSKRRTSTKSVEMDVKPKSPSPKPQIVYKRRRSSTKSMEEDVKPKSPSPRSKEVSSTSQPADPAQSSEEAADTEKSQVHFELDQEDVVDGKMDEMDTQTNQEASEDLDEPTLNSSGEMEITQEPPSEESFMDAVNEEMNMDQNLLESPKGKLTREISLKKDARVKEGVSTSSPQKKRPPSSGFSDKQETVEDMQSASASSVSYASDDSEEINLAHLPCEIMVIIMNNLDHKSLVQVASTCKRFHQLREELPLRRKLKIWRWSWGNQYTVDDIRTAMRMIRARQLPGNFLNKKALLAKRVLGSFHGVMTPIVTTAASMAKLGFLNNDNDSGSVVDMRLKDIDITSIPPDNMAALCSVITDNVYLENITGNIQTIMASVKCRWLWVRNMILNHNATEGLLTSMRNHVEEVWLDGVDCPDIDIIIQYDGLGRCGEVQCWDVIHRDTDIDIIIQWAKRVGWKWEHPLIFKFTRETALVAQTDTNPDR